MLNNRALFFYPVQAGSVASIPRPFIKNYQVIFSYKRSFRVNKEGQSSIALYFPVPIIGYYLVV